MKKNIDTAQFIDPEWIRRRHSVKHEKANQRRILQKTNQVMKNILTLSRMRKLDLIAINNRSICNYSKKKRAQQTQNRFFTQGQESLPQLKRLRVDFRCHFTQPSDNAVPMVKYIRTELSDSSDTNRLLQYNKCSSQQRGDRLISKKSQKTLANLNERNLKNKSQTRANISQQTPKVISLHKFIYAQRSKIIYNNEYKQNIQKINEIAKYEFKLRSMKQRIFLRKLKQVKKRSKVGSIY